MNLQREYEVVVIGGGAAGLLAAAQSARRGRRTLLLEKNNKLGVKILMSGGTRCNLTHQIDARGIAEAFGPNGRFLYSALAALSPQATVALLNQLGVATKVESGGKVFPVSNRAVDVRDALVRFARQSGCQIATGVAVMGLVSLPSGIQLTTARGAVCCQRAVITTGGKSYPGCGTTGDAYAWLSDIGHSLVPPRPALTPLVSGEPWLSQLKGITIDDVRLTLLERASGKKIDSRRGSFLFTHFGMSGPAAMDLSGSITRFPSPAGLELIADFLPAFSGERLRHAIAGYRSAEGKRRVLGALQQWLPRRLAEQAMMHGKIALDCPAAELSNRQLEDLIWSIKKRTISVGGTRGFGKAEVTAGGLCLDELDSRTMRSRVCENLFAAGEVLDLDGPIGGYNFQSAFSTGWLAGQHL